MASTSAGSNGGSEHTEALYREHGAAVAALCRSLLRNRGEAEDAAQQVFLSAHRALLAGTVPREPLAWLLAVARHECYARFRRRAATPVPAGEAPERATEDASVHALRSGELANLWDEVGQMPRAQREAFLLREIRGLSYGQLAAELSLTSPSVRSLLLRARTRLRHRLGDAAAGLGVAQWVQALLRIVGGGEGASPVPAAAKAVAVGLGALALAGGGSRGLPRVVPRVVHPAPTTRGHGTVRHPTETRARRVATPAVAPAVLAPREGRSSESSTRRDRGSGSSGSRGGGDATVVAASHSATERGDGRGSEDTATTTATPPPLTTTTTQTSSGDGGQSGRDSGSDGAAATVTTTTSSGLDGTGSTDAAGTSTTTTSDGQDGVGGH